jgi:hypothetical protein
MGIEAPRYPSDAFIGTFEVDSEKDMKELQMVKEMVSRFNSWLKESNVNKRYRVVIRGRKPYKKMKATHPHYSWCNSKGEVSYDYFGNIVGGIRNASVLKAFIYERR